MTKYEYSIYVGDNILSVSDFNQMGRDGWNFVGMTPAGYVFKRVLVEKKETTTTTTTTRRLYSSI